MSEGQPIQSNRVDQGGGFLDDKPSLVHLIALSGADPGVATLALPARHPLMQHSAKLGTGPWVVTIAGVTGADAGNINGERTLTRTGDRTASIGVDTAVAFPTFTIIGVTVTGGIIDWIEDDANIPSHTAKDWKP